MSASILILTAGFAGLVVLGVPFAIAIAAAVIGVLWVADISPALLPQMMIAGTQSFSLLGIPFFMLASELMTAGGLSRRLIAVADVFVRHLPGEQAVKFLRGHPFAGKHPFPLDLGRRRHDLRRRSA